MIEQPVSLARVPRNCMAGLFHVPEGPRTAISIVGWWEARRFTYNVVVGAAGIATCMLLNCLALLTFESLVLGVLAWGICANICYTSGWICELISKRLWREKAEYIGPILFSLGLPFSFFLTLAPGIWSLLGRFLSI